jgi:beta-lactamase superfamily II metal-dependent hydrolase
VARYRALGAQILRTDISGALEARIGDGGIVFGRSRDKQRRYWHGR